MSSYHSEEQTLAQLPSPSTEEVAHSSQLVEFLIAEMERHGGNISFRDFMEAALYRPGLGYYTRPVLRARSAQTGYEDSVVCSFVYGGLTTRHGRVR